jgi:hypothetical protein
MRPPVMRIRRRCSLPSAISNTLCKKLDIGIAIEIAIGCDLGLFSIAIPIAILKSEAHLIKMTLEAIPKPVLW